ncbi:MAG: hypothetical protein EDM05_028635 [Leptolyngbya sp. IPPAS B-1204]|nr:hypothetical protein [Elainella sp. C42_A2020_010]RNJ67976.1 MAG: hypothetical protein EDM05_17530 [Leptolyngbya sp. IPPAS B-1204]
MNRSKVVAVVTGAIAILLSIAYLLIVQFLDFRGEMVPAPTDLSHLSQLEKPSIPIVAEVELAHM